MAEHERVEVTSRDALRQWLKANHQRPDSIWLVTWKKPSPRHVPYDAIVEEALCFGWIDSQPRSLDDDRTMVRLSPRKPTSGWSAINKRRVEHLIASGRMADSGMAAIEVAKRNGAWTVLDDAHALEPPPELVTAFERHPGARDQFLAFPPSARRAILEWIALAKREETRAARIEETARLAARGERANAWKR